MSLKAAFALSLSCIASLAACEGDRAAPLRTQNHWIMRALEKGMTEQQVARIGAGRVPDSVVETTCGTQTPKSFQCKAYVYDEALRQGQYDPKLTVVFEKIGGRSEVIHWF